MIPAESPSHDNFRLSQWLRSACVGSKIRFLLDHRCGGSAGINAGHVDPCCTGFPLFRPDGRKHLASGDSSGVMCGLSRMPGSKRIDGYAEALRVLKPGGTLLFNVWDRLGSNELADITAKVIAVVFPDKPTSFLARTPYSYYEEDLIRQELSQAGFSSVTYETLEETSSAESPHHAAIAFCQGTPQRIEIEAWDANLLDDVTDRVEEAIASSYGAGQVTAKIRGHIITAVR